MKKTILILLSILPLYMAAQIEPCKQGASLISAIQLGYTPNQTLGYDNARDTMYSIIDINGSNVVECLYTGFTVTFTPNTDPSTNVYQNGAGLSAEHLYPQSKGASNEPARSDLFNLRPAKNNVNNSRGNCPFADIVDTDTDTWFINSNSQTSIPNSNIDAYSEKENDNGCYFEPRESVKGDVARSIFYFYTIYQTEADAADATFFSDMKSTLIQWHYSDPVDAAELSRNNLVKTYQGNDNPFILDSTLARRAYFLPDANYSVGDPNCFGGAVTIYINEVDSDNSSTDTEEFIELYDGGVGNTSLTGYVVVLFNGTDDKSYKSIDLDGYSTNANGYFVLGSSNVANVDLISFTSNGIQNGADAVALYNASASDFPTGTLVTTTNLIDAIVYDTDDADDTGLLSGLGKTTQYNENENGNSQGESIQRSADGSYFIGSPNPGVLNVLPVELSYFQLEVIDNIVQLEWKTETEENNDKFIIERSLDGISFEVIGKIQGVGTSYSPVLYKFEDKPSVVGINYYRLKQVDFDGSFEYSKIIKADIPISIEGLVKVYPTVFSDFVTVDFSAGIKDYHIDIINTNGSIVLASKQLENGKLLGLSYLPAGMYYLRFVAQNEVIILNIVKL